MAVITYFPKPSIENIVSMITVPPNIPLKDKPMELMIGNTAFFKAYRYVNAFDGESLPQVFSTPDSCFAELCDIKMKKCESHLRSRNYKKELAPKMSPEFLQKEYPKLSPALFSLLHSVSEQLEDEMK